jgi:inner membrane protein involved in colicin E2 resistance
LFNGSLLAFGLIATAMMLAREFDWYALLRRGSRAETI